jgi:hypothetical protein
MPTPARFALVIGSSDGGGLACDPHSPLSVCDLPLQPKSVTSPQRRAQTLTTHPDTLNIRSVWLRPQPTVWCTEPP